MAVSYTPRLGLSEMADGEQSGYLTYNDVMRVLDCILNTDIEAMTLTTPPGSPQEGQIWFVPAGATGAWAGQEGKLAQWYNGAWFFHSIAAEHTYYNKEIGQRIWIDPVDLIGYPVPAAMAALIGSPAEGTLGTGGLTLTNWGDSAGTGPLKNAMNATTGVFTAPTTLRSTALYRINIHVHGDQGNSIKEESIFLNMILANDPNAGTLEIAHESVDTDKTSGRTLSGNYLIRLADGATVQFELVATAGLGTFSFQACTFDVEQLAY